MNATEGIYESPRLVLRQRPADRAVAQLAASADWTLLGDNREDSYAQYAREQTWGVRRGLHVHVLTDALSEYGALTVLAEDRPTGEQFTHQLKDYLDPFSRQELVTSLSGVSAPSERMMRLMRMFLSSPAEFDQEIFDRVTELSHDEDPRVRDATTLATNYAAWPQFRSMLRELADNDPHPGVRQDAAVQLQMFDESGVPEE